MWDDFDECISDDFIDKYRILIDAKILFLKRDDLKIHLNSVWDNIDEWWLDKKHKTVLNYLIKISIFKEIYPHY